MMGLGKAWWLAVAASGLVGSTGRGAAADEPRPTVEIRLVSEQIYLGEVPSVRIVVTAPADRAAPVVKAELALGRHAVRIERLLGDGSRIPRPRQPRNGLALKGPDAFATLEAGQSVQMDFPVRARPERAGDYLVRVGVSPTPDEDFKVETDLLLTCRGLPEASIVSRVALKIPINADPGADYRIIEMMNGRTDRGYELLFRRTNVAGTSIYLKRLLLLDADSRLVAIARYPGKPEGRKQIWLAYNRGDDLYFARIESISGDMLEQRELTPVEGKSPEGAR